MESCKQQHKSVAQEWNNCICMEKGPYNILGLTFSEPKLMLMYMQGEDGSYGTSVSMSHAMDPANDVLLAYKQNGRWLTPDHGFPVRMIIPGFIGGRMVKWLSEITVTKEESNNYYHYHDNRVLPPHVDEKLAKEEGEECNTKLWVTGGINDSMENVHIDHTWNSRC